VVRKDLSIIKDYVGKYILPDSPDLVFLTGSRALGNHKNNSDVDLCVIGNYSKSHLRQPILDFIHITKYPKTYRGYTFEIEYETYSNLDVVLSQVLKSKLWKFQNARLIYGTKTNFKKLNLKLNKFDSMRAKVWLLYNSKDLIKKAKSDLEIKLSIAKSSESLLKLVFLINEKPIPSDKWLLKEYSKLSWKPRGLLLNISRSFDEQNSSHILSSYEVIFNYVKSKKLIPKEDSDHIELV